jgi:hypothetical protein
MKNKYLYSAIIAGLFGACLFFPAVEMIIRLDPVPPRSENRVLAARPVGISHYKSLNKYVRAWQAYTDDNFGFRNFFIFSYGWIRYRVFGVSPTPDVILGKDGWLFLAKQKNIELHRGVMPYSPTELDHKIDLIRQRYAWSLKNGIKYIYTVGPDSLTLNPEFLPDWARYPVGPSRWDQILAAPGAKLLPLLDLRPTLLAAKKFHMISYKTDSHWNAYGAYIGYRALLAKLREEGAPVGPPAVTEKDLKFRFSKRKGMDLTILAGQRNSIFEESEEPEYIGKIKFTQGDQQGLHFTTENPDGVPLTVICLCDSMAGNLYPYLARQFRTVRVMWGYPFDVDEIRKYKADIVIQMVIERSLGWPFQENPVEVRDAVGFGQDKE